MADSRATDTSFEVQCGRDRSLAFVLQPEGLKVSVRSRLKTGEIRLRRKQVRELGSTIHGWSWGTAWAPFHGADSWAADGAVVTLIRGQMSTLLRITIGRHGISCRIPESATVLAGLWLREAAKDMS